MAAQTNGPFPTIQSKHSLVAKHVTKDKWEQLLQLPLLLAPANTRPWLPRLTDPSPPSSPSILLLPSTSPRTNGSSSRESRPRLQDSPLSRQLLVLLSLTTSTVASTLVTGTPTRTSPPSSTLSSVSTTESAPLPSTHLTWMPARSREMLSPMLPSTLAESVLAVPSMALAFLPESPRTSVSELRS